MNLTLIGMPGSGKSFVGEKLAERLGFSFVDIDTELERRHGMPLQQVVEQLGEQSFLDMEEAAVISETTGRDNLVISPGGSVVYREAAMRHLKNSSTILYLAVPFPILEKRVGTVPRGIIYAGQTLQELYAERTPLYEQWSDYTINGDGEVNTVVDRIANTLAMKS